MATKVAIEHNGPAYAALFKSFQPIVDEAGESIASRACSGYSNAEPPFKYYPKPGNNTAMGFVSSDSHAGAYYEARDKALTRAVG